MLGIFIEFRLIKVIQVIRRYIKKIRKYEKTTLYKQLTLSTPRTTIPCDVCEIEWNFLVVHCQSHIPLVNTFHMVLWSTFHRRHTIHQKKLNVGLSLSSGQGFINLR